MFLSSYQSLRTLRVGVCRIACVLTSLLLVAPFAAAQGLESGGPTDMGSVAIGTSSLNYTFTFTATSPTTIQSATLYEEGKPNADFSLTNGATQTCTGTIQTSHSCNVNVTLTPQKIGLRRGAIVILDNSNNIVFTQFLYGVGLAPQISFAPVSATAVSSLSGVTPTNFKPSGSVYDGSGNLYIFDYQNSRLLKLDTSNTVTVLGSFAGNAHSSLAINGAGTLYLTLPTHIEVISTSGVASTLATPGVSITSPGGIAIDGAGFVYVTDSQNNTISRIAPDGSTAAYVPTTGVTLSSPFGLAVDYNNLYVADSGNGRIVAVSIASGVATALTSTNALNQPYGIAVDASGTLVAADAGGSNLVQISPAGTVAPVVSNAGFSIAAAPLGVLVTTTGDYVSSDSTLGLVFITRGSNGQLIFPTSTKKGSADSTDGYETMTVQNSGNQIINLASTSPTISNSDFALGPTNACPVNQTTSAPLAIASSCTYTFGFTPTIIGTDQAAVSIRGTAVGTGALITNIDTLIGTGISPITAFSIVATPAATTPGVPVGFTVTALQGSSTLTTFTGMVTFTMTDPTGAFLSGTTYTFTTGDQGKHTFTANLGADFNTPGTYIITVTYSSTTATSNQVTVAYASNTVLASSANPTSIGGQTTLTATVSGVGTGITPTTTVTFYNGVSVIGTCTLIAGTCSINPTLAVGSGQLLKAVYGGDTNFSPSTSNIISQTVAGYNASFVLQSALNPSTIGQQVTFTATVIPTAGQSGATTPTGSVTIKSNGTTICTMTMTSGAGSCNMTYNTAGSYTITASYTGDPYYAAATSNTVIQVVNNKTTPTAMLTSSLNPSVVNQQVTFTATMAPPAGSTTVPTGTVTFTRAGGVVLCTTAALVNGVATCDHTFTVSGTFPVTATYSGNGLYNTVASNVVNQVVNDKTTPAIGLTSSLNPSVTNQQVTFTATMTPPVGSTTVPTGTVTFTSNGTTLCATVALTNGVATCSNTYTTAASYSIVATYNGNTIYNTVASTTLTQVVNNKTTPTAMLTSSLNPSVVNQQVTFTATMTPSAGSTTVPTGTVTFTRAGGVVLCTTAALVNGVATCDHTFTVSGTFPVTATYNGNGLYNTVASNVVNQIVNDKTTPTIGLTSSLNPSVTSQQVTFTATMTPPVGSTTIPTGTVTFTSNGTTICATAALTNGVATCSNTYATSGSYSIVATYNGNTIYNTIASTTLTQVVNKPTPTIALTSSLNPSVINQQVTFTATMAPPAGSTAVPTGTVAFTSNGTTICAAATITNGVATCSNTYAIAANYSIVATYSGSTTYNPVTSTTLTQVVNNKTTPAIALTSSLNPSVINQQVTFTATMTPPAGSTTVPTGTVAFTSNGTTICAAATITNGVATCSNTYTTAASYSIVATYSGNAIYNTVASTTLTQVVNNKPTPTVGLSSSSNPTIINQQITYTATPTPPAGSSTTPTGTVTFKSGATTLCTANLLGGSATCNQTYPTAGSYPIVATYNGDTNYSTATSSTLTEVVNNLYTSTTTMSALPNPAIVNATVTLSATVVASPGQTGAGQPAGTVTFRDGTTTIGTCTLVGTTCTTTATFSTTGTHSLTAVYGGSSSFSTSTSAAYTETISAYTATSTLTSSINPSTVNQLTTLTATIAPAAGQTNPPAATGTITFYDGVTSIGTCTLASGACTKAVSFATTGNHSLTVRYAGDTHYAAQTSAVLIQVVNNLFTSQTSVSASPNPATLNAAVTLSATAIATPGQTGAGTPTGTMKFYDGTTLLNTCTLSSGTCSISTSFTTTGAHSINAVYNGDTAFNGSTSAITTETINGYSATVGMTSSVNPSTLNQQTTLSATVAATSGQTNPPALTGTATFFDGATQIGSCTLISGACATSVSFTTAGNHFLTAKYSGDANYSTATSTSYTQVVNNLFIAQLALAAIPNPVALNTPATLTATVSAAPGQTGAGTASGTVRFYDGTTLLGTCTLTAGTCNIQQSFTAPGTHSITAQYSGDTAFNTASTALAIAEVVNGYTSTVALASSVNPSAVNQQTLLTATVTPTAGQTGAGTPTGTVSFFDGATQIATCTLAGTSCSSTATFTTTGTHSITAVYSGNTTFNTQTSATLSQVVSSFVATIALSASPSPVFINNAVALAAAVAPSTPGGPAPGGTVTFLSGTTPLGSAAIINGVATLSTSFPNVATYSITAVYNGNTNYSTVTSTATSIVAEDFTFTLTTPVGESVTVMGGHAATYTFTVTPVGGTTLPSDISLALAGFPANSVYSFSPATVTAGSGTTTVTLTVTPPVVAQMEKPVLPPNRGHHELPITFALLLLPFAFRFGGKRGRRPAALLLWMMMMAGALGLTGCLSDANSGYYGADQQSYALTATASSGSLSHAAHATLVRQ